jgi:hypothetical protein
MRRGWSDRDTWSLDWYLAGVISGSVAYLRDHGHTYPGEENGAGKQQWHDILTRIAGPLSVNRDRIIDGETPAQRRERQEHERAEQQEALRLLARWVLPPVGLTAASSRATARQDGGCRPVCRADGQPAETAVGVLAGITVREGCGQTVRAIDKQPVSR